MLFTELPQSSFPIHRNNDGVAVMWADKQSRTVYARDMLDFNLINARDFTDEENFQTEEEAQAQQDKTQNAETINDFLYEYLDGAIEAIGPPSKLSDGSTNPDLVPGLTSINAMIAQKNQDLNGSFATSPATYLKPMLRWIRQDRNALIALVRSQQQLLDSADIGSVE